MHSTPSFQWSNCFGESDIFFLNGPNGGDNNHHDHHHPRESGRFSQLGRVVSRWGFVIARDGENTKFLLTHHFPRLDWERINDQMSKKMIIVILFMQNYTSAYPYFFTSRIRTLYSWFWLLQWQVLDIGVFHFAVHIFVFVLVIWNVPVRMRSCGKWEQR